MGYLIEIETKEMQHASEYAEKALKYMGKVMQCISSWEDEAGMGERGGMNYREEDEEYGRSMMGSRRGYGMRGLDKAVKRNFQRWNIWDWVDWVKMPSLGSYEKEVAYLKEFYSDRLEWLDRELNKL